MPKTRHPDEQTTNALAALLSTGMSIDKACAQIKLSPATFHRWRKIAENGEGNAAYEDFLKRVVLERGRPQLAIEQKDWRTREAFDKWARTLTLDSGEPWRPESWQLDAVEDMLSGRYVAVWLVVPEGNGKTTLVAGVVLYLLEHQLTPEIPIASATTTQADTMFRQIRKFIVNSGKLVDFHIAEGAGARRIDSRKTHGHARVYPHNEKSAEGAIYSAAVLDEGHLHPNLDLYRIWEGKADKRNGTIFMISTAGDPTSEFEEIRANLLNHATAKVERGPYVRAVSEEFGVATVIHDWAVRDKKDVLDFDKVAEANPLSTKTATHFAGKHASPAMIESHWLRRTCNIPARESGQAIESEDWDGLFEEDLVPIRTAWSIGYVDLGWQQDSTVVGVLVWEDFGRRVVVRPAVIEPPVKEEAIVMALAAFQREYNPVGWVYDPNAGGQQMAQLLERGVHPDAEGVEFFFIEHSQGDAAMALATARLDEAIRSGWLVHDGHSEMRRQVLNAVRKNLSGERSRYAKPPEASGQKGEQRKRYWNDALIGLAMGHSVAVAEHEKPEEPEFEVHQWP